mgnify:CR=1 FL=1
MQSAQNSKQTSVAAAHKESVFEQYAWKFIEREISVIPIAPGTKKPGQWSQEQGWRGMGDWTRFSKRLPTELELEEWSKWPEAGIGVVLGPVSKLTCLDKDYDLPNGGNDALQALIPWSPIAKKGEKGWTRFYLHNGERSCSFDVNGLRVLDVLAEGRQTVVPPSAHPSGCNYVWITEETLDNLLSVDELPKLPDDFLTQVARVLAPYQTEHDVKYQRKVIAPDEYSGPIDTSKSVSAQYYHELNERALLMLDEWVPKIVPMSKQDGEGWRTVATWRGAKNQNVGIHPTGIRDWGGNYGMTPIDLVMYANGMPFVKAAESLRRCLPLNEPEPILFGAQSPPDPKGDAPATPRQDHGQPPAAPTPPAVFVPPTFAPLPWDTTKPPEPVQLPPTTSFEPARAVPAFISNPPGMLGEISRWISATAPKSQHELALAAAIALCSVVMGRTYRSQYGNWTSLYLIMVAKSTEGKEHPQGCVEKILTDADLPHLIGGSGYTSSGAVYSALLKSPCHVATIDEMGKLLKMSRAKGQANSEAALDKLIEAFGRMDGVLRPPTYSQMTLSKGQASNTERIVHNPAITLLGATTPATFFENLTDDLVKDGFLGRCIVVESKQPRQLMRFVERSAPPKKVLDWCKSIHVSAVKGGNLADVGPAEMPPSIIELPFSESCMPVMQAFERELNDAKDSNEAEGLDVLLGRTLEKAMKLAMIACKAIDPKQREVLPEHLTWAVEYVRHYDLALIRAVRKERIASQHDGDIKRVVKYLKQVKKYKTDNRYGKACEAGAMPHSKLLKLMAMPVRQFKELIDTAKEANIISVQPGESLGCAGEVYFLLDTD